MATVNTLTPGNDFYISSLNGEIVEALAGDDAVLLSGVHDSTVFGGDGDDAISAWPAGVDSGGGFVVLPCVHNVLDGGDGDDVLTAYDGDNTLVGGAGNDVLCSLGSGNVLVSGSTDDRDVFQLLPATGGAAAPLFPALIADFDLNGVGKPRDRLEDVIDLSAWFDRDPKLAHKPVAELFQRGYLVLDATQDVTDDGTPDTVVKVDMDGIGGPGSSVSVVIVQNVLIGVTGTDIDNWIV